MGYRFGIDLSAISVGRPQHHDNVVFPVIFYYPLDAFLAIQIHGPGGSSDKALGLLQEDVSSGTLQALGYSRSLNTITLAYCDDFLAPEVQLAHLHGSV